MHNKLPLVLLLQIGNLSTTATDSSSTSVPPQATNRPCPHHIRHSDRCRTAWASADGQYLGRCIGQRIASAGTCGCCRAKDARRSPMPCRWNRRCTSSAPSRACTRRPLPCHPSAMQCKAWAKASAAYRPLSSSPQWAVPVPYRSSPPGACQPDGPANLRRSRLYLQVCMSISS